MIRHSKRGHFSLGLMLIGLIITAAAYVPGLHGGFLFDDFPNIVDNKDIQPIDASLSSLIRAMLSSPASELKRPLASLSFAINYLLGGLDPFGMKLTNLVFHLINGCLVFLLGRQLIEAAFSAPIQSTQGKNQGWMDLTAAAVAAGWMLLPINLTGVLYIVQRMESMANLFILAGLWGYVKIRRSMIEQVSLRLVRWGSGYCLIVLVAGVALGLLAKETAILLPLYALIAEMVLFQFRTAPPKRDTAIVALFVGTLLVPLALGLAALGPWLLKPETWAARDFTMRTRLLSEARIVIDYAVWTIFPTPNALSFYHDDYVISQGLLLPWTTLASCVALPLAIVGAIAVRRRLPLVTLGVGFFIGGHLLTDTIIPLELVYEHRNYFSSFGLLLAFVPLLLSVPAPGSRWSHFALAARVSVCALLLLWTAETAVTAMQWSSPLRLAVELASRAPGSPRAQYELGRTYIIYSHYDPASPFTKLAYPPLERAANIPSSSILPLQALIFMNSRMGLPIEPKWWDQLITKLRSRKPGVQDESSLGALTQCAREGQCDLPKDRMTNAYLAALEHPNPSARLLAMYGDYAWNVLNDKALGLDMTHEATVTSPRESAYLITLIRMEIAMGQREDARRNIARLQSLDIGGSLDRHVRQLTALLASQPPPPGSTSIRWISITCNRPILFFKPVC